MTSDDEDLHHSTCDSGIQVLRWAAVFWLQPVATYVLYEALCHCQCSALLSQKCIVLMSVVREPIERAGAF